MLPYVPSTSPIERGGSSFVEAKLSQVDSLVVVAIDIGRTPTKAPEVVDEIDLSDSRMTREKTVEVEGRRGQDFDEVDRLEQVNRRESQRFERDEAEEEAESSSDESEVEETKDQSTMEILNDEGMDKTHEESFTEELAREGEEQLEDEAIIGAYERRTTILQSEDTSSVYRTTIDLSHLSVPEDSSAEVETEPELEEFDSKVFANESVEGMLAQLDNLIQRSEARNSNGSSITTSSDSSGPSFEEEDNGIITFASIESVHHLSQLSPRSFASSFSLKRGDSTGGFSVHERSGSFGSISENMSSSSMFLPRGELTADLMS